MLIRQLLSSKALGLRPALGERGHCLPTPSNPHHMPQEGKAVLVQAQPQHSEPVYTFPCIAQPGTCTHAGDY